MNANLTWFLIFSLGWGSSEEMEMGVWQDDEPRNGSGKDSLNDLLLKLQSKCA